LKGRRRVFTQALKVAGHFTFPYVGMRRRHDGVVFSTLATFIVLNRDGWALTSAHVLDEISRAQASVRGVAAIDERMDKARRAHERQQVEEFKRSRATSLSHHVEIWAVPGFAATQPRVAEYRADKDADLALVRLEPFDAGTITGFPLFRDATEPVEPGMSVCRLGYPFHSVDAIFDEDRHSFDIQSGFPVPRFALEAIVSRFQAVRIEGRQEPATFIETSSPGLRGQSGGPLLDVSGRVCGVQSHTAHLDLGFDATYERAGERVVERQFLNIGRASHVDGVRAFLAEHGVMYESG
jgi:hypothetical protein